tara:strand:+ start:687 stop:1358 length:672 start_codon:yes stop_codon:yes gene_type:complete
LVNDSHPSRSFASATRYYTQAHEQLRQYFDLQLCPLSGVDPANLERADVLVLDFATMPTHFATHEQRAISQFLHRGGTAVVQSFPQAWFAWALGDVVQKNQKASEIISRHHRSRTVSSALNAFEMPLAPDVRDLVDGPFGRVLTVSVLAAPTEACENHGLRLAAGLWYARVGAGRLFVQSTSHWMIDNNVCVFGEQGMFGWADNQKLFLNLFGSASSALSPPR